MKYYKSYLILLFVLSAVFRLYRLSSIPEGFHADEAVYGYNAYSILKTGEDEYGKKFPLIFQSFGDYKGAIYSYLTMPFIAVFGLNEFAVRLPTALAGLFIVALSIYLIHILTRDDALSLLAGTMISFSPSSLILSRVQSDPLVGVCFIFIGWYCIDKFIQVKKWSWIAGSIIFWVASCFTNPAPRVLLLGFIPLLFIYYLRLLKKWDKVIFFLTYITITSVILCLLYGASGTRYGQTSVFSSQEVILPMEEQIREDGISKLPAIFARAFHNKSLDYGRFVIHNYSLYFGFDFLFFQSHEPVREKIPNTGFLYLIDLPFLLIGLYQIVRSSKRWGYFIVGWLLFTPLSLSIYNQETPNIHRYYFSILPLSLLSAYGIDVVITKVKKAWKTVAGIGIVILYSVSVAYFLHQLFIHQPLHEPYFRGYAYKELVYELEHIQKNYDRIVITKAHQSPYIYFLFYMKYDPLIYQRMGSPRDLDYSGFDKFIFVPDNCPGLIQQGSTTNQFVGNRTLYVNYGGCEMKKNSKLLKTIYWRNHHAAFQLVENVLITPSIMAK